MQKSPTIAKTHYGDDPHSFGATEVVQARNSIELIVNLSRLMPECLHGLSTFQAFQDFFCKDKPLPHNLFSATIGTLHGKGSPVHSFIRDIFESSGKKDTDDSISTFQSTSQSFLSAAEA